MLYVAMFKLQDVTCVIFVDSAIEVNALLHAFKTGIVQYTQVWYNPR